MLLRLIIFFFISQPLLAQHDLKAYLESVGKSAKVSLLIQDMNGNNLYEQNSNNKVPSASIIKIPILFTLFSQIEDGEISLDEVYELTRSDIVGGSGELQDQSLGGAYNIEYLAREMIRVSDNTATNILINRIGIQSVNKMMTELSLEATQLNRLMMDFEAIAAGRQNYTSPAEMNRLLLMLQSQEVLSLASRELMLDMLYNCADSSTIPGRLPVGLAVAHKTGTLDYVRGDAGIIFSRNPLAMSIFVEEFSSLEEAEAIIATVALIAYETFGK